MTLRLVSWFARTCVLWALAFAVLHASVAQASISLSVTYTGDNFVKAFYVSDGTTMSSNLISAHPSNNNWQQPTTAVLNGLSPGTPYTLYFRVWNDGPYGSSGNPAAFLAEITGDVTGNLVTNSSWEWALDPSRYARPTWRPAPRLDLDFGDAMGLSDGQSHRRVQSQRRQQYLDERQWRASHTRHQYHRRALDLEQSQRDTARQRLRPQLPLVAHGGHHRSPPSRADVGPGLGRTGRVRSRSGSRATTETWIVVRRVRCQVSGVRGKKIAGSCQ